MVEQILAAIKRGKELLKNPGKVRGVMRRGLFTQERVVDRKSVAEIFLRGHPSAMQVEVIKTTRSPTVVVRFMPAFTMSHSKSKKLSAAFRKRGYSPTSPRSVPSLSVKKGREHVGFFVPGDKPHIYFSAEHAEPLLRALIEDARLFPGRFMQVIRS